MRTTILLLLALFLAFPAQSQKPNIIVIFADDMGYGDMGTYGHPTIKTPNFDRMAQEGMKFYQFYTSASVCTPSRAGLLTGRYPVRTGMTSDQIRVLFPPSASGLPHEEVTIAEVVKEEGYKTAIVGKWHLGHTEDYLPLNHGFDSYFGIPYSNDMSPPTNDWIGASIFPPTPLMRDQVQIESEPDQRYITRRYTEEALNFIRANKDDPFFLYLPHSMPHLPIFASPRFEGRSLRGLYGDVIEELDWSVGQVMQTLENLGIAENTMVIFTSDNGPWLTKFQEGGSAGLFHDGKGTTWEGGMRVPTLAWWPGTIEAGAQNYALTSTLDLLPTIAELAGAEVPDDRIIDGRSMVSVLKENQQTLHDAFFYWRGSQLWAARMGPWKMHLRTQSAYVGDQPVEHPNPILYNLLHDPSEKYEISAKHPEIVAQIQAMVADYLAGVEIPPSRLEIRLPSYDRWFGGQPADNE